MLNRITVFFSFVLSALAFFNTSAQVTISGSAGVNGSYASLTLAGGAFSALNTAPSQAGNNIIITVTANLTSETGAIALNEKDWTTLTILPNGARTISGTVAGGHIINLNGADNVTINGLNTAGHSLIISNLSTSPATGTSTIKLERDATGNTITKCSVLGSSTMTAGTNGGNIYFGANAVTNGSDNNIISNCDIGPAGVTLPTKGVYSNGTTTSLATYNSNNTITACRIFDCFGAAVASSGVYISSGSAEFTISNNRIYQTATRTHTSGVIHAGIQLASSNISNCNISGNIVGYANGLGTGTYNFIGVGGSKFYPIVISEHAASPATNIQGNTVTNISVSGDLSGSSSISPFAGIMLNSSTYILDTLFVSGNTIGSSATAGAITFTSSSTVNSEISGIGYFTSEKLNISNNIVGGLTVSSSSGGSVSLFGIKASSASGYECVMHNNSVGFTTAQLINNASGTSSRVIGMYSQHGASLISYNTVTNLTMTAANIGTGSFSSVIGIWSDNLNASLENSVSQNTVNTLSNSNAVADVWVTGIHYRGSGVYSGFVERNFLHSFSMSSSSSAATMNGIYVQGGIAVYQNNMISLGIDASGSSLFTAGVAINGIIESSGTDNFYFNSLYIGGTNATGSGNSYAFLSYVTGNSRNFRNNIFYNGRSNGSGTGKHYAVRVGGTGVNPSGLTINNNIYLANGTGGVFGFYNGADVANLAAWKSAVGQDVGSFESDPQFINPAGNVSTVNLHINPSIPTEVEKKGFDIVTITNDFDGQIRSGLTPVDIGADAGKFRQVGTPLAGDYTVGLSMFNSIAGTNVYFKKTLKKVLKAVEENSDNTIEEIGLNKSGLKTVMKEVEEEIFSPVQNGEDYTGKLFVKRSTNPDLPKEALAGVYANLTAAIDDLNSLGASASVRFLLTDSVYASESLPLTIIQWPGASEVNTLTVKPNTGVTSVITGNNSTALFDINTGDFFILDGSNTINGSSKDLTLQNFSATASTIRFINDAKKNTIKNCVLKGNTATTGVVYFSTTTEVFGNDSNLIQNNDITKNTVSPIAGVFNFGTGTSSSAKNSSNRIIGNRIFDFFARGISEGANSAGTLYEDNEIYSDALQTQNLSGFRVIGTNIEGFTFRNNYIHDLKTSAPFMFGIELSGIQNSFTGEVYNNFVSLSDVNSNDVRGIADFTTASSSFNIYFNSVNITGNVTGAKNSDVYYRLNANNTNFKNNILVNTRTGGTGKHYAVRTNSPLTNFDCNYNNIFSGGGTGNVFGKLDAVDRINLADWQTASGKDSNSVSGDPKFVSEENLHINNFQISPVSNAGIPLARISNDFDYDNRNSSAPDIGADEYFEQFPLSGDYAVGLSSSDLPGVYETITAAINDLNLRGASGPVRFLLLDNNYNSETLPIAITSWSGASASNTLTIKPNTGVTSSISGNGNPAVFDINTGDYFILDGSNAIGGNSKDLTISNTSSSSSTIRFINDARNNTIKNCIIKGSSTSGINGVIFFSTTSGSSGNDSNLVQNNDITKNSGPPTICVYNNGTGTTSASKNSDNKIIGNRIFDFFLRGFYDQGNSAGTLYESNEIFSVASSTGFQVAFRVVGSGIEGFTFRNNYIHDLKTSASNLIYGIELSEIQNSFTGEVYNNFISLSEENSNDIRGIVDGSPASNSFNIYYNSVNISGSVTGAKNSDAYHRINANNTSFKNNILVNSRTGGSGKHYAIRTNSPLTAFTSDFNDIYSSGGTGNIFGKLDAADKIDLADWQTASGKDSNSISADPLFISSVNLHIDTAVYSPVNAAGIPITGITYDIDGNARSLTAPDIGADEFNFSTPSKTLNLTLFIQGFYDSGLNTMIQDTVKVYLRNNSSPYAVADTAKAFMNANGTGTFLFENASDSVPYYLHISHRNSVETWSSSAQSFTSGVMSYDFTNSILQAFGSSMIQINSSPLKFGIYGGDVNQDLTVDLTDLSLIDNDANNFIFGYVSTDLNGDEAVDISDAAIADNNAFNFVSAVLP
ncbi:MAG TPA: hypothetical protein PK536_05630 [Ignavibacteria bacterium]|nr:hypothetical protein [Bacteroidota bacterium]HRI84911.1 hypothetical protein [Ignavibacteria bacterium]HRJ98455.1 hypothetical protein [Ignavibacteria bacterium]